MIWKFFRKEKAVQKVPLSGKLGHPESSDRSDFDVSRGLTPKKLDTIMVAANTGDVADQCRLALELEEKNHDIAHAISTRRNAVLGIEYSIEPGSDAPADRKAAEAFKDMVNSMSGYDSFDELLSDLMTFLLPGFAASEIIWKSGGGIAGFSFIEARHFTLTPLNTAEAMDFEPRLITRDNSMGMKLPDHKFVVHKYRRRGRDISRGGLIRPLAWLHCFANLNLKDLLRFIERYGMPFAMATVDEDAWNKDRNAIKQMIRNFGPDGGGVFSKAVELKLVEAANNTGDVYFRLLEYVEAAITKVILGQTATAGDGSGWNNGSAQSQVRQDILEFDCRGLENTVNTQIIAPWMAFNYPNAKAPRLKFHCEPPEDMKAFYEALKARFDAMGVAIRAGLLTPTPEVEEAVRETLELPKLDAAARAEWTRHGGVKRPITLKDAPAPKIPENAKASDAKAALSDPPANDTPEAEKARQALLNESFAPLLDDIARFVDNPDEKTSKLMLGKLSDPAFLDLLEARGLREDLEKTIYGSAAQGISNKADEIRSKDM